MDHYCLPITCLACGGEVEHVNAAAPRGEHAVAIVACEACGAQWVVDVVMRRHKVPKEAARAAR